MDTFQDLKRLSFGQTLSPSLMHSTIKCSPFDFCPVSRNHHQAAGVELSTHAQRPRAPGRKCSPPRGGASEGPDAGEGTGSNGWWQCPASTSGMLVAASEEMLLSCPTGEDISMTYPWHWEEGRWQSNTPRKMARKAIVSLWLWPWLQCGTTGPRNGEGTPQYPLNFSLNVCPRHGREEVHTLPPGVQPETIPYTLKISLRLCVCIRLHVCFDGSCRSTPSLPHQETTKILVEVK